MRIVFDTNILVSALVFPGGRGEAALLRIVEERDQFLERFPGVDRKHVDAVLEHAARSVQPA